MFSSDEVFCIWMLITTGYISAWDTLSDDSQALSTTWLTVSQHPCSFWDQTGCGYDECCVKEVISFEDLDRNVLASTICKPMLSLGELCLRQSEGYLCDCSRGLQCKYSNNETYGHCG
ncbi:hypothetical protein Btru_041310 [Bulinus truncatus]|nr:hypothetical protein Btru_041310 [Bulinus truncatus]